MELSQKTFKTTYPYLQRYLLRPIPHFLRTISRATKAQLGQQEGIANFTRGETFMDTQLKYCGYLNFYLQNIDIILRKYTLICILYGCYLRYLSEILNDNFINKRLNSVYFICVYVAIFSLTTGMIWFSFIVKLLIGPRKVFTLPRKSLIKYNTTL